MKKLQLYHFHNGRGGGVLAVIKNLIKYSKDPTIENHIIHAINRDKISDYTMESIEGCVSQQLFNYSSNNNFYYTCRKLSKLLPDEKAIVVAHDWLELGMVSNLGLQNPVVHIVHGNYQYYYELALKHSSVVDAYIGISDKIAATLKNIMPHRINDISQYYFPVPGLPVSRASSKTTRIIYFVRDLTDPNKRFDTLIKIADKLSGKPVDFLFTIVGAGMTGSEFEKIWPEAIRSRVKFLGARSNEEIHTLLSNQDIFLLPSLEEGLPVSLIESMKAGVIPLVTQWDEFLHRLVIPGETGYHFEPDAVSEYVNCIDFLRANPDRLKIISENCKIKANRLFDPLLNTIRFEEVYNTVSVTNNKKKPFKVYGSRLDHPRIPNFVTKSIRKAIH
ncbi:MAG: glycosyltransferase family 4 protein [Ferruginibacter sp.]